MSTDLARLSQAEKMLASIDRADEALVLADLAEAARVWAVKAKAGYRVENYATSIKARAEIRMVQCVDAGQKRGEIATAKYGHPTGVPSRDACPATLESLGIKRQRLSRARKLATVMTEADVAKAIAEADAKKHATNITELERRAAKAKREQDKAARAAAAAAAAVLLPDADDRWRVLHKDIREVSADIEDGSLGAIITDPPYSKKYIPLYGDLAELAAAKLKPGGSLVCMVGQSYLPQIIVAVGARLTYQWTLAYLTPGGQSVQLWERKVNAFWKPLLWYVKGEYDGKWVGDVCRSDANDNDKRFHRWGQSVSGMADVVERFSEPGGLVCDPFCGGGTTAVAALAAGRKFIGIDINEASIAQTKARIAGVLT